MSFSPHFSMRILNQPNKDVKDGLKAQGFLLDAIRARKSAKNHPDLSFRANLTYS
jgi:hypothetical protein